MSVATDRLMILTPHERATLAALLHQSDLTPRLRERLEMVKAADLGFDLATIAAWTGRTETTVRYWLGRYQDGGIAAVRDAPRPGRPPKADAAYLAALEQAVDTPPRVLGLPFDVWTSARLGAYLTTTTGVRVAPGWLRVLLARQRFSCSRPKHTLGHLQDADEVATCQQALARAGGARSFAARPLRTAL
jgi:transposase